MSNLPVLVVTSVQKYDSGLCQYLEELGLPAERVLAALANSRKVISNLPDAIVRLQPDKRGNAIYISKMQQREPATSRTPVVE